MSTEVRVDPLTGLKVIIATERAGRPGGGFDVRPHPPFDPAGDPFLPGHEDRTPPELHRVPAAAGDGWQVRVVGNLYPALAAGASEPPAEAEPDLFAAHAATGAHEVIVNAPEPVGVPRRPATGGPRDRHGRLARPHARPRRRRPACT